MARKKKGGKVKIAVSIDAKLYERIVEFVEATERRGGVSGALEDCARRGLVALKEAEAPELVRHIESLENRLSQLKWVRQQERINGDYTGDYEDEIAQLEMELAEEKREIALEEAGERKTAGKSS